MKTRTLSRSTSFTSTHSLFCLVPALLFALPGCYGESIDTLEESVNEAELALESPTDLSPGGTESVGITRIEEKSNVKVSATDEIYVDRLFTPGDVNRVLYGALGAGLNADNNNKLPAGNYDSTLLHYDPPQSSGTIGNVSFDFPGRNIVAVIWSNKATATETYESRVRRLAKSDAFFKFSNVAVWGDDNRGFESTDSYVLADHDTLTVVQAVVNAGGMDEMRVLTCADADTDGICDEMCDGVDNDHDGSTDEGCSTYYGDVDGDGHGNAAMTAFAMDAPAGYVTQGDDCNDVDANIHPGAIEFCDDIDSNCDGNANDAGRVSFVDSLGVWSDVTSNFAQGTIVAPQAQDLSTDGTLWFCDGTYYVSTSAIGRNVSIIGRHGSQVTTLSGAQQSRVLRVEDSTIHVAGLTIADGFASNAHGGGLYALNSTVTIADAVFENNVAGVEGGSYWSGGGAVFAYSNSAPIETLSLTNTVVRNNRAKWGGGLALSDVDTILNGVEILDNDATAGNGGGIHGKTGGSLVMTGSTVSGNVAASHGGGMVAQSIMVSIQGSTFANNDASGTGGAMYVQTCPSVTLSDCVVSGNGASWGGGGLYVNFNDAGQTMTGSNVDFSSNAFAAIFNHNAVTKGYSYSTDANFTCNMSGCQ